jgi:hypothetical protein
MFELGVDVQNDCASEKDMGQQNVSTWVVHSEVSQVV